MYRSRSYLEQRRRVWKSEQAWLKEHRKLQLAHIEKYNREHMHRDRNRERRSRSRTSRTRRRTSHSGSSSSEVERVVRKASEMLLNAILKTDKSRQHGDTTSQTRTGDRSQRETNRDQTKNQPGSSRNPRDSTPPTSRHLVDRSRRRHNPVHHSPESHPRDRISVPEPPRTRSRSRSSVRRPTRTRSRSRSSVRSRDRDNNSGQDRNRSHRYDQHHTSRRPHDPYPEQPTNRYPPREQQTRPPTGPRRYGDHMTPRQNQRHNWRPQRFPVNHMGWTGGPARYPNFPRQNWPVFPILYSDGSTWHPPRLQPPPPPYGGQYPPHGPGPNYPGN